MKRRVQRQKSCADSEGGRRQRMADVTPPAWMTTQTAMRHKATRSFDSIDGAQSDCTLG